MNDVAVGADEAARERDYEAVIWKNLRRNYLGHFIHGMLGMTGFRLVNAPTFIPAYLHAMSGSDLIVSLGTSLQQLGGVISPIAGAAQIEHRKRILPVSMFLGTMMRLQILGIALAGWFLGGTTLLVSVLIFLFLLGLFSGPQGVAFQFLLAKMIPISRRGRLQGLRRRQVSGRQQCVRQRLFHHLRARLRADEPRPHRVPPSGARAGAADGAASHADG
jgi:hypothetical protein